MRKKRTDFKNDIKLILYGAVALLLILCAFMLTQRGLFTAAFRVPPGISEKDIKITMSDPDFAEVRDISVKNYILKVKLKTRGIEETDLKVGYKDNSQTQTLRVNKLGMVVSGMNSNFSGWQSLIFGGTAIAVYAAVILLRGWLISRETELLTYLAAARLGFFLFTAIFAVLGMILCLIYVLDPMAYSFGKAMDFLTYTTVYTSIASAPFVVIFAVLLCVSNISLIRHEGLKKVNILGILISGFMLLFFAGGFAASFGLNIFKSNIVNDAFLNVYYGIYMVIVCLLFALFIIFFRINKHVPELDQDCIIILGCRVKADGTLYPLVRGRVDKALEFARLQEHTTGKPVIFIPSGGMGGDETVSEGEAMKNYLLSQGVSEEQIIAETEAETTMQNIRFSVKLAQERKPDARIIFATTNYHVFRSGIIASQAGYKMDGIGSRTKWYFWPNALIREFIGLIAQGLGLHRS